MMKQFLGYITLIFILAFSFCTKDKGKLPDPMVIEPEAAKYAPVVPEGWPQPAYNFSGNPVTYDGFTLGRYLFYETVLSDDTTTSCGTCHQPVFGFSNGPSHVLSHGVHDLLGKRNAPALFNLTWSPKLMWDGAVNNLENQPLAPLSNPVELNISIGQAVTRLSNMPKYKALFKKAYGDTVINSQRILKAFAQFMGLLVSYQSKYDKVKKGEDSFTAAESNGYTIFKNNCAYCHAEPLFSDYSFRNKGLPITALKDSGQYLITQSSLDIYKFKVPSLRNLGFTAPYMHDGRFTTIEDVLTFFTTGVANTQNLDPFMATPHVISTQEKSDLISFLNTLNDYKIVNDERFKEIH